MQFTLRTLIILTTFFAGMAAAFVGPALLYLAMLLLTHFLSPAIWITGCLFARGTRQVFFIGGFIAGLAPWIAVSIYSFLLVAQWDKAETLENYENRLVLLICWLSSGALAIAGGLLSAAMYRFYLQPEVSSSGKVEEPFMAEMPDPLKNPPENPGPSRVFVTRLNARELESEKSLDHPR
jgi:hypothetical protein